MDVQAVRDAPLGRRSDIAAGINLVLLLAASVGVVVSSAAAQWHPSVLVVVLLAFCVASDLLTLRFRGVLLSGSFIALVLAMALLGPAPAAAIGVASMVVDQARKPVDVRTFISNLATYATFPLIGGLALSAVADRAHLRIGDLPFLLLVFATFFATNLLNFGFVASWSRLRDGVSISDRLRTGFLPMLPAELAAAVLTVAIVGLYAHVGLSALGLAAVVLIVFQYLTRELLVSQERGGELERRNRQLADLHVGILTTMLQTLSLRDPCTARHSAAVARYARALAAAAGCSDDQQELVHTAALLHDIGKFILPDSILFADAPLSTEDWNLIRLHPVQGAELVGRVEGYAAVAEIIHAHHERPDGLGYPNGLEGDAIPLLSRIIAVADTYDVMTARDSYREPVTPAVALNELRLHSGQQFDAHLVEAFARLLLERGVAFRHADDADFEEELAFERRVAAFLVPRRRPVAARGTT